MTGLGVAGGVAWVQVDQTVPEVVVARVPEGPPLDLAGPAAVIWLAAIEGGDAEAVVVRVAAWSEQPVAVVEADVRSLLDDLVARGLLSRG